MTEDLIKIIKLTASEGYILTNGQVYSKEVYLGINDSIANWNEITEEAYEVILNILSTDNQEEGC